VDCFYCPGFTQSTYGSRKMLAIDPDDKTQMNESKDPQVGWRGTPVDLPVDLYVSVHYSIFGGWVRSKPNDAANDNPMVILMKPDEPVPVPEPNQALCPRVAARTGAKNSSEIPIGADATFRESQVAPTLSAGSMIATANQMGPTLSQENSARRRYFRKNVLPFEVYLLSRLLT
jgi:hypothetical protein